MEYKSVIRNNEILPFVITQMNLEVIMPGEKKEKYKYCMFSFMCGI